MRKDNDNVHTQFMLEKEERYVPEMIGWKSQSMSINTLNYENELYQFSIKKNEMGNITSDRNTYEI